MDPTAALLRIAADQVSVVHRRQVRAVGLPAAEFRRQVRQQRWEPLGRDVWGVTGVPDTPLRRVVAAVLDAGPGAAASHRTAAAVFGIPGFALLDPLEVSRCRSGTGAPRLADIAHLPRRWPDHHRTVHRSTPVTTPERTLFDLAAVVHPGRVERALDTMWARRLVTVASLQVMLEELAGRGRAGIGVMRKLIDARGDEHRPPESGIEARFDRIVVEGGERPFDRQVVLGDDDGPIGRVDFVDVAARIVVEIDSDVHHTSLSDRRRDAERDRRLRAAGWLVLRFSEFDVWHRPDIVLAAIREARRDRRPAA